MAHLRMTPAKFVTLAVAWAAIVAFGCAGAASASASTLALRIGVQGSLELPAQSEYAFATLQNKYAKAGLKVTWTTVDNVSDCARAIAGGSLDACTVEAFGALNAVRSVPGLRLVAQLTNQDLHYLIVQKNIKSVKQLAGQKIGSSEPDSVQTLAGQALFKKLGANPSKSTWVDLGATVDIIQSFEKKQLAGAMVVNPFQLTVPGARILGSTAQSVPTYQVLLAKPTAGKNVIKGLEKFLKVTLAESSYMTNPRNASAIEKAWVNWTKITPKDARTVYNAYKKSNHWTAIKKSKFAINLSQWKAVAKLETPGFNPSSLVNKSILKATFPS